MRRRSRADVLPITTARSQLFDIVEDVLTGERTRVEVSHRAYQEHVVLMRKEDLERLESDLAALRARVGQDPRPLRGLGTLKVEAGEVLSRSRAYQRELAEAKRAFRRDHHD